ncbi:686_t:CDS:2, partial [Racocetra fulgida]
LMVYPDADYFVIKDDKYKEYDDLMKFMNVIQLIKCSLVEMFLQKYIILEDLEIEISRNSTITELSFSDNQLGLREVKILFELLSLESLLLIDNQFNL